MLLRGVKCCGVTLMGTHPHNPTTTENKNMLPAAMKVDVNSLLANTLKVPIEKCNLSHLGGAKGFLLDLDGTVYNSLGLLDGAVPFFNWLEKESVPYVLASNGIKTREGVASKFKTSTFKLSQVINPQNVITAAMSLSKYMEDNAPKGSHIYALGTSFTYGDGSRDFITRALKKNVPEDLYASWDVRTDLTDDEIAEWAHRSKVMKEPVFVVLAVESNPHDMFGDDPVTKRPDAYTQMDFGLVAKVNTLLRNGGHLIAASPDVAHSMPRNTKYPDIDTAHPTMGGWESAFLTSAEMFPGTPREIEKHANTGKGGNQGATYFMIPAIDRLRELAPGISLHEIVIVGDNFGTDIKAGNDAGIKSILVLDGAHRLEDAVNWPSRPTCYLQNIGEIPKVLSSKVSYDMDDTSTDDSSTEDESITGAPLSSVSSYDDMSA